jgi:single-stranded-DNA-specific exonuclease
VGVAYRLAQALLRGAAQQKWSPLSADQALEVEELLLDFVAIGTVADMMPLQGANRSLVRRGLERLNRTERPGLEALISQAGLQPGSVDAAAISFRIAPRINAAGRLSHAKLAYRLLRTTDPAQAFTWTSELEDLNQQRRSLTLSAQKEAERQVADEASADPKLIVAASPDFRSGVVGLVAGKLAEQFYRPALVIEEGETESRGSARSIEEFDISRALDEVAHLLVRHGGHSRAAGFTVRTDLIPEFVGELHGIARRELDGYADLRPLLRIDAPVSLGDMNWAVQVQMARLEPTGQGNPAPLFKACDVRVREARAVGAGKHLKLVVDTCSGSPVFDAIAFGFGDWAKRLDDGSRIDIVFGIGVNEWQGRRTLQLTIEDLRPASA